MHACSVGWTETKHFFYVVTVLHPNYTQPSCHEALPGGEILHDNSMAVFLPYYMIVHVWYLYYASISSHSPLTRLAVNPRDPFSTFASGVREEILTLSFLGLCPCCSLCHLLHVPPGVWSHSCCVGCQVGSLWAQVRGSEGRHQCREVLSKWRAARSCQQWWISELKQCPMDTLSLLWCKWLQMSNFVKYPCFRDVELRILYAWDPKLCPTCCLEVSFIIILYSGQGSFQTWKQ